MPSRSRLRPSRRTVLRLSVLGAVLLGATSCVGGDPDPPGADPVGTASGTTGGVSTPTTPSVPPAQPVQQPPLPADPSGYTPEYVQATLTALFHDYQAAVATYKSSGEVDAAVETALADVYHPDVFAQQIRNLEDYFPGGENLKDPPGTVQVEVTDIHSVAPDCILAITTYDISAVTSLDAPAEDGFFIGLARNPDDADGTRPWLITVEYGTSDGEPLPEDACA